MTADAGSKQRLAAILAADAAGYSRLMSADEAGTVAALDAARAVFRRCIETHQGRVVDMAGDSVLAVFGTAIGAMSAALAVQRDLDDARGAVSADRQMRFRIGVHLGDVIEKDDGTVYGDGVNMAARLQALAEAGGISVSEAVQGAVRGRLSATFADQGEQVVKNMPHPVRVFAVNPNGDAAAAVGATSPAEPAVPNRMSIAVLPFANMSGDPEQDYFADGMVEDIITALAGTELFVIARNSSFVYKGRAVDIKQVGRELGVCYVLEGSVRKSGNRVRITGQLIEADKGHHLWADRFEGTLDDVFELQDRITESIVSAIEPSILNVERERVRFKPTSNLQAYELALRALPGIMPSATGVEQDESLALLRRALELDPHYSLVKAMSAFVCWRRVTEGLGDATHVKTGLRLAEEALSEKSGHPLVLSYSGLVLGSLGYRALGFRVLGFRYDQAERAIERALSLGPNLVLVQYCAGVVRGILGEGEAALGHFERAMRISPFDPAMSAFVAGAAGAHLGCGRIEQALLLAQRAVQENPNFVGAHRMTVIALGFLGRIDEAKLAAQRILELTPAFTVSQFEHVTPFRDPAVRKRLADVYRAAGVPE
jgi:adenylate cyclase